MTDNDKWLCVWRKSVKLWVDDDAIPSSNIEGIFNDLWRCMGSHRPLKPKVEIDLGDATLSIYEKCSIIIFETSSYPGNSDFRVANDFIKRSASDDR